MYAGHVTARALIDAYLERIERYDQAGPELNAVVTINQAARERADELAPPCCEWVAVRFG
jgi:amidase